ncbi:MAG: endonuclease III [Kofleriaceae bacterium]
MGRRPRNSTPARPSGGAKSSSAANKPAKPKKAAAKPKKPAPKKPAAPALDGKRLEETRARAAQLAVLLAQAYPDARVELDHRNAFELIVATILSAQSTDKTINTITPALFAKYPDANALAVADLEDVKKLVVKSGFFNVKAASIVKMAQALVRDHGGEVPRTMDELVRLPGVARKTANVVLGSALDVHVGVVVDTHVVRLSNRLGLSAQTDPVKIEQDLMAVLAVDQWTPFAHRLIWHGRRVCFAAKPDCDHCTLAPLCPSAFKLGTAVPAKKK